MVWLKFLTKERCNPTGFLSGGKKHDVIDFFVTQNKAKMIASRSSLGDLTDPILVLSGYSEIWAPGGIQKHASMPKFRKFRLQNSKKVAFD